MQEFIQKRLKTYIHMYSYTHTFTYSVCTHAYTYISIHIRISQRTFNDKKFKYYKTYQFLLKIEKLAQLEHHHLKYPIKSYHLKS